MMSIRTVACARVAAFAITLGLGLLPPAGCAQTARQEEKTWAVMGTLATLTVAGADADRMGPLLADVTNVFAAVERDVSIYRDDSDIGRLNAAAGKPVAVKPLTLRVLEASTLYAGITQGAFDPTVAPLVRLWGFSGGRTPEALPSSEAIDAARKLTGIGRLQLDARQGTAMLATEGMKVDLGGIAKGYAVDLAWEALAAQGVRQALVNLGGNMRCLGVSGRGKPWRIGVRNPFDRAQIIGAIDIPDGWAVASSGNYERFVMINDERYTHIIDPRTGRPVKGMAGVTIIARTALETDGMSTGLFVLGVEAGAKVLATRPDCHALFVPDAQPMQIHVSPGMAPLFVPLPEYADRVTVIGAGR